MCERVITSVYLRLSVFDHICVLTSECVCVITSVYFCLSVCVTSLYLRLSVCAYIYVLSMRVSVCARLHLCICADHVYKSARVYL